MSTLNEKIIRASDFVSFEIQKRFNNELPEIAIVLGSGLSNFTSRVTDAMEIQYADIPEFPVSTVPGHAGMLVVGRVNGRLVAVWAGRSHYYEGKSPDEVTFYVRLTAAIGVKTLFISNAAGALTRDFAPGELMVIDDHINFTGMNPMRGPDYEFIDMTYAYSPEIRGLLDRVAAKMNIRLHHGVYVGVSGPSYETPAEIRAFGILGGHAVGMSTVPEVIIARKMGLKVAAVSCITNYGAGLSPQPLSHDEVKQAALQAEQAFGDLVEGMIDGL